eukprot:Rmarinus@m.28031
MGTNVKTKAGDEYHPAAQSDPPTSHPPHASCAPGPLNLNARQRLRGLASTIKQETSPVIPKTSKVLRTKKKVKKRPKSAPVSARLYPGPALAGVGSHTTGAGSTTAVQTTERAREASASVGNRKQKAASSYGAESVPSCKHMSETGGKAPSHRTGALEAVITIPCPAYSDVTSTGRSPEEPFQGTGAAVVPNSASGITVAADLQQHSDQVKAIDEEQSSGDKRLVSQDLSSLPRCCGLNDRTPSQGGECTLRRGGSRIAAWVSSADLTRRRSRSLPRASGAVLLHREKNQSPSPIEPAAQVEEGQCDAGAEKGATCSRLAAQESVAFPGPRAPTSPGRMKYYCATCGGVSSAIRLRQKQVELMTQISNLSEKLEKALKTGKRNRSERISLQNQLTFLKTELTQSQTALLEAEEKLRTLHGIAFGTSDVVGDLQRELYKCQSQNALLKASNVDLESTLSHFRERIVRVGATPRKRSDSLLSALDLSTDFVDGDSLHSRTPTLHHSQSLSHRRRSEKPTAAPRVSTLLKPTKSSLMRCRQDPPNSARY